MSGNYYMKNIIMKLSAALNVVFLTKEVAYLAITGIVTDVV